MPRKPKSRKSKRKKTSLVRYQRSKLSNDPIGKRFLFKTRYYDNNITINPGVGGTPAGHVFLMNSLFDPDFTGVGHQPIGFDQIMPLYQRYTVLGAKATVTFSNYSDVDPQTAMLKIQRSSTAVTDIGQQIENGNCVYTVLAPETAGGSTKTLTINYSARKFFTTNPLDDDLQRGTQTTNPSQGAFLHLVVQPVNNVDSTAVRATVRIDYVAMLTEPKLLAQS